MDLSRGRLAAIIAAAIIGAGALGAGVVHLVMRTGETASRDVAATEGTSTASVEGTASEGTPVTETAPATDETTRGTSTSAGASDIEDGRYFGYVRDVQTGSGRTYLVVDYAQFLTGEAAARAAAEAGEESPPPNDYFIVNANPKLRTIPISPAARVLLAEWEDHHDPADPVAVPIAVWTDRLTEVLEGTTPADEEPYLHLLLDLGYWFTIHGGTITVVEQQWVP